MKYSVLLSGAGQLGSRYLQGLFEHPLKLTIYVHDISHEALERCILFCEKCSRSSLHDLNFASNFDELPNQLDLVIVSSTADARSSIVKAITKRINVRYWILEKVLTQNVSDLEILKESITQGDNAWVNTARRSWEFYHKLKEHLNKNGTKQFFISGAYGLACNAIHFIDLFSWLISEHLISIDTSNLYDSWFESKRKGFWEVSGEIKAIYSEGSTLILRSEHSIKSMEMVLIDSDYRWDLDEHSGFAKRTDGIEINGNIPLQSQSTPILIKDIFSTGSCNLTSLTESIELHKIYLEAFQTHWNRFNFGINKIVQIT
jgi:hypothetical protein